MAFFCAEGIANQTSLGKIAEWPINHWRLQNKEEFFAFSEMNTLPIKFDKTSANLCDCTLKPYVCVGCKRGAIFPPRKPRHSSLPLLLGLALISWTNPLAQESHEGVDRQATVALAQPPDQPGNAGIGAIPFSLFGDCDSNRFVFGQACLSVAAAFFGTGTLEWLLDKGIGVNDVDETSKTALHWAAFFNDSEVVNFLVEKGSDLDATRSQGKDTTACCFNHRKQ